MTQTELDALIQEIDRAKKAGGKNIVCKFNLKFDKTVEYELNEDGSYPAKRKPIINDGYLVLAMKMVKTGDNRTSTSYDETYSNEVKIIPIETIESVSCKYDIVQSTPVVEPEQPVDEQ